MPPKIDQGVIIVLDIGRNVSGSEEKEKSFFENALECTIRIIERKILSQGKNYLGIILLGSKRTYNNMSEQCPGAFKHIQILYELTTPNWQMIRDLPDKPSNSKGNWLDALVVAADHFKNGVSGVQILNKKVILMTNFEPPSGMDYSDIEVVVQGYKDEGFEVDVIGPDIYNDNISSKDFELVKNFVESTNGQTAPFEDTMRYLLFHRKKMTKPSPWNVDLSIGPNIKIPISAYIRIKEESVVNQWRKAVKDPVTLTASTTEGIMRSRVNINVEDQRVVSESDIINGYSYGQQVIPLSEADMSMLYKSGEKCLSVYGFTNADNITWQNFTGDGVSYIFGRKGDKKSQHAIRCLIECLLELNLVGIVRRVYNNGNAPKMYALMPVIDSNDYVCLSMVGICYKEDIKNMAFPPTNLKKYAVTDEQVNAFKDLIKAMDLTKAYDDTFDDAEAFPIAQTVSPLAQYVLDCIAFRAMNPGKPLPEPREDIKALFKQPALIEKRSKEHLDKLKSLFTLTKVEKKTRKKPQDIDIPIKTDDNDVSNGQLDTKDSSDIPKVHMPIKLDVISRIGTIDPISDYKKLVEKGKTLSDLSPELTNIIENLFYCNLDGVYGKALKTMSFFREECVKGDPSHYNNWLKDFKMALNERKKTEILDFIVEKQLGFIVKEENSSSTYETQDSHDDQLYENDTVPNTTQLTIPSEINDMFDD